MDKLDTQYKDSSSSLPGISEEEKE